MTLPHRISFLETPDVLQKEGLLLDFIFVANDVSHIRRGYVQPSVLHVREHFISRNRRGVDSFLLLHLVVLALHRDAPATQIGNFSPWVEIDSYRAALSPVGP